jgi:pimeloyl-ACP methyl ester carboxylesterase
VTLSVAYYLVAPLALAVYATHPPRADAPARTPAVAGIAYRDVGVPTSDGVRLSGWFIPSTNGAAVLVLHGSGSSRAAVLPHVLELAERGYGVLAIDARGHGRSGGRPMEFGWHGEADVAAAVSVLLRQPGVDASRIGVLGMSMGGEQALTAAAADPRIAAVVAEGATMRAFADVASIPAPAVSRWLSAPHYWLQFAAADLMTSARQPIGLDEAVGRIAPRPVLLIAGGEGSEIAFSETYAAVAPASTYVWAVPDTPHVQALQRHPVEWRAQVLGFFDGALTG